MYKKINPVYADIQLRPESEELKAAYEAFNEEGLNPMIIDDKLIIRVEKLIQRKA